jgi:hypothetical protein
MKELTINGQVFAKYQLDGGTIFIKMLTKEMSEDLAIHLIGLVEATKITHAAYLNV